MVILHVPFICKTGSLSASHVFVLSVWTIKNIANIASFRGGSRILLRRGRQPSREEAQTYDFGKFSEKLHEIEKILEHRGARAGSAPLRSATVIVTFPQFLADQLDSHPVFPHSTAVVSI